MWPFQDHTEPSTIEDSNDDQEKIEDISDDVEEHVTNIISGHIVREDVDGSSSQNTNTVRNDANTKKKVSS